MASEFYPPAPTGLQKDKGLLPPYVEAALFLLCGMIIGGGATTLLLDRSLQQTIARPEQLQTRLLDRMDGRLALTDQQRTQAEAIIDKHFAELAAIQQEVQPQIKDVLDTLRNELSAVLNDEQRIAWESRFEAIRAKWRPGPLDPEQTLASDTEKQTPRGP